MTALWLRGQLLVMGPSATLFQCKHLRLVSNNKNNNSQRTTWYFISAPGAHPSNFTGSALNSTHIYLTWDPPPPLLVNGVIREYRVNVTENATGQVFVFNTSASESELTVGSLHPHYTYHCTITGITVQQGPYTALYDIQTEEDGTYV